ncbi:MAG TPA: hypothetical protein VHH36_06680 [Candidatus Thermoplasmatota archaeon]|nr:hypothetical protein [Candidatus Thermoplasmatota archaeon]
MSGAKALALAALLLPLAGCGAREEPSRGFEATHWDSRPHDEGFEEVFRVDVARGTPVPTGEVAFLLDGEPVAVRWEQDADGVVSAEDRFAFVADAFDRPRRLEARAGAALLWSAEYRGGAGTPV